MLAQQPNWKKWNRRQFQAALLSSFLLSNSRIPLQASTPAPADSQVLVEANNALALTLPRALDRDKKGKNNSARSAKEPLVG